MLFAAHADNHVSAFSLAQFGVVVVQWYSGEWFAFFFINGLALTLETALKELWRKRDLPDIPKWISTPVTIFVLLYLAELLFYPPVVASGWSQFGVDDIKNQLAWMGLLPAV